jgi:hypothetical protein
MIFAIAIQNMWTNDVRPFCNSMPDTSKLWPTKTIELIPKVAKMNVRQDLDLGELNWGLNTEAAQEDAKMPV